MLWVLKRTVSMRQIFEHPKHMFKFIGKEMNAILRAQTILIWTYVDHEGTVDNSVQKNQIDVGLCCPQYSEVVLVYGGNFRIFCRKCF